MMSDLTAEQAIVLRLALLDHALQARRAGDTGTFRTLTQLLDIVATAKAA